MKSVNIIKIFLFFIVLFYSCSVSEKNTDDTIVYENSFENESDLDSGEFNIHSFNRSNDIAFEGEWALKVTKEHNYQINLDIEKLTPNEIYDISIWRYGNKKSFISIIACNETYKVFSSSFIKESKNGWDLLVYRFKLPPFYKKGDLKFYVSNLDTIPAYYDNLVINKYNSKDIDHYYNKEEMISLDFDTSAVNTIINTRKRALNAGVYIAEDADVVNAKVKFGTEPNWHTAEIRLKGDWVTHLEGYRWSFRVKLTDGYFWNGIKTFSLQKPDARGYIYEWLFHKYLDKEGVLTTRYGFLPVKINNRIMGTYAWEEHFEKQIVEHKKKREGPIVKFDESIFWYNNKYFIEHKKWINLPVLQSAKIIPFKKKKTLKKSKVLKKIFENGQNNLYALKFGYVNENIVDFESYSKLYALIDIFTANHMFIWHNRRFYINPVSMKLEPIAFDGFTEKGFHKYPGSMFVGTSKPKRFADVFEIAIFKNKAFREKYINALNEYSDLENIKAFVNSNKAEIDNYVAQIRLDEPFYSFDTTEFYKHVSDISTLCKKGDIDSKLIKEINIDNTKYSKEYPEEFVPKLVIANKDKYKGQTKIAVSNYNSKPIVIIGVSKLENTIQFDLDQIIKEYNGEFNDNSIEFLVKYKKPKYVFYKIEGNNKIFKTKIDNWRAPKTKDVRTKLLENSFNNKNLFVIKNDSVIFKQGSFTVSDKFVFPKGYKIIINEGTQINFIKKSCFYSESPVYIKGTQNQPIVFNSSDKTAEGVFVLETEVKSEINNLKVNNFNTFSYKGWKLSGAVSFYKADVLINNIEIYNNLCEDALNIISSNFELKNSVFKNIFSDAFDSDFSDGKVLNSSFENICNDALDFSTSTIEVHKCGFNNIGDKAISAGENSNVIAEGFKINGANFGFVSKDKSVLNVKNSSVANVDYCFAAYIKKPEFGASILTSKNVTQKNVSNEMLIDKLCSIIYDNKEHIGNNKIEVDSLYAKWKK